MSQSKKVTRARIRTIGVLSAVLLGGTLTGAGAAAAEMRSPVDCHSGEICLWRYNDMQGEPTLRWSPGNGLVNLPPDLHDHVGSFVANASGCFIDTNPRERRNVHTGDYNKAYMHDGNFGSRIDQVAPNC